VDTSAGAGIYAGTAATQYVEQPIANNGLIIALDSNNLDGGDTSLWVDCVSNSSQSGVGEITGRDGTTLTEGAALAGNGTWRVVNPFSRPGVLRVRAIGVLTAGDQGIYTCTIPDDSGNNIAINVGLYPSGFNGEYNAVLSCIIHFAAIMVRTCVPGSLAQTRMDHNHYIVCSWLDLVVEGT